MHLLCKQTFAAMLLATFLVGGWTTVGQGQPNASDTASIEVTTTAIKTIQDRSAIIKFTPGSAELTPTEKDKLRDLVENAGQEAPVKKFVVAAWADSDYPEEGAKLSKVDRTLAQTRGEEVEKALKDLKADSIDTYSMATHPSWISRLFGTESSSIKTGNQKTTKENEVAIQIGQKLRSKGGPGSAVVIVWFENQVTVSH